MYVSFWILWINECFDEFRKVGFFEMFKNPSVFLTFYKIASKKNQKFDFFLWAFLVDFERTKNGAIRVDVYLQKPVDQFATQEKSCKHGVEPKPLKTYLFLYILECEDSDDW